MTGEIDALFGSAEVVRELGITYRQLHHWCGLGLVEGVSKSPGSGYSWEFTSEQVERLREIADGINQARRILEGIGFSLPFSVSKPPARAGGRP